MPSTAQFRPIISPVLATKLAIVGGAFLATFLVHLILQHQYYRQCKSNMFKVLFMQESEFCRGMHQAIATLEGTCVGGTRYFTSNVFSPLFSVILGQMQQAAGGG